MLSEYSITLFEPPKNPIEETLSRLPPITNNSRYYEFAKTKPGNLWEQLNLLLSDWNKNTTVNLMELLLNHDNLTYYHSVEVGVMSWAMGSLLGLDPEKCFQLGLLHDVGKLGIDSKILSLRFVINFDGLWNKDHTEFIPYHYQLNDDQRKKLQLHGVFGKMILKHLGFDSLFQQVAQDHGKSRLTFSKDEPLELMIVTLADWFSAIKDLKRNEYRGTDTDLLENAKVKIEEVFADSSTNLPKEVKQAFWDMIKIFKIYPPKYDTEEGEILYWYRLFDPFYKDVLPFDSKKPLRPKALFREDMLRGEQAFYITLPDLRALKEKIRSQLLFP